ncbi:hypothetical protein WN943_011222 [Citrus x changshan-huyou]
MDGKQLKGAHTWLLQLEKGNPSTSLIDEHPPVEENSALEESNPQQQYFGFPWLILFLLLLSIQSIGFGAARESFAGGAGRRETRTLATSCMVGLSRDGNRDIDRVMVVIRRLCRLSRALPHQALTRLSKQHGPVMKLQLGELLALVISSPGATQEVLKTNEISFAQRHETFAGKNNDVLSFNFNGDRTRELFPLTQIAPPTEPQPFGKIKMILVPLVEEILPLAAGFVITDLYPSLKFLCSTLLNCAPDNHDFISQLLKSQLPLR